MNSTGDQNMKTNKIFEWNADNNPFLFRKYIQIKYVKVKV